MKISGSTAARLLVTATVCLVSLAGAAVSAQRVVPVDEVREYDDVRWKDLSRLDLSDRSGLIQTLTFNQDTVWPPPSRMPPGRDPRRMMAEAMNPGLGLRELHAEGITGRGVVVAIIDQIMSMQHPEFAGKILSYVHMGRRPEGGNMHGPGVASLLVGENTGTAPGARAYYAAVPSGLGDALYPAMALTWLVDKNAKLPPRERIRVVSVSAAPSGPVSAPYGFRENQELWDQACRRAAEAGILVLDGTIHRGFVGPCWYEAANPEDVTRCTPGFPGRTTRWFEAGDAEAMAEFGGSYPLLSCPTGRLLVPCCPRTAAEEYDRGEFGYQYRGRAGLSWSVPYCAGVLALGWQLRPELTPGQMVELLFKSAYIKDGHKIINPKEFIRLVREYEGGSR